MMLFSKGTSVALPFASSLALVSWLGVHVHRNLYQPSSLDILTLTAREI